MIDEDRFTPTAPDLDPIAVEDFGQPGRLHTITNDGTKITLDRLEPGPAGWHRAKGGTPTSTRVLG